MSLNVTKVLTETLDSVCQCILQSLLSMSSVQGYMYLHVHEVIHYTTNSTYASAISFPHFLYPCYL